MAIVVPIVSEWNPKGVNKATADIKRAEGGWAKTGAGFRAALVPAGAALVGIGAAALTFGRAAEESAKASARLGQTLGNVKGIDQSVIDRQEALATSLMESTAVDDEVIKGGQAILATFQKLGATAGTVGGAFDRATAASVDLAAAGFGSVEGNAKMLGKALENPVKGLAVLTKAGVTFTDQQQEQIKAWTESGDVAKAQEAILAEVEKQVGGTGAATATSSAKMASAWGETQEALGEGLLPAMEGLARLMQKVARFAAENKGIITALVAVIAALAAVVVLVNAAMSVAAAVTTIYGAAQSLMGKNAARAAAGQWALNAALLANPVVLIVVAVIALVAAIFILYRRSEVARRIIDAAFRAIGNAVRAVVDWVKRNWPLLLAILTGPFGLLVLAIVKNKDRIIAVLRAAGDWIKRTWGTVTQPAQDAFDALWRKVQSIIDKIKRAWGTVSGIIDRVNPFSSAAATYGGGGTIAPMAARSSGAAVRSSGGGITVNVYGAIDPDSTGRRIRQILSDTETRLGSARPRLVL